MKRERVREKLKSAGGNEEREWEKEIDMMQEEEIEMVICHTCNSENKWDKAKVLVKSNWPITVRQMAKKTKSIHIKT